VSPCPPQNRSTVPNPLEQSTAPLLKNAESGNNVGASVQLASAGEHHPPALPGEAALVRPPHRRHMGTDALQTSGKEHSLLDHYRLLLPPRRGVSQPTSLRKGNIEGDQLVCQPQEHEIQALSTDKM